MSSWNRFNDTWDLHLAWASRHTPFVTYIVGEPVQVSYESCMHRILLLLSRAEPTRLTGAGGVVDRIAAVQSYHVSKDHADDNCSSLRAALGRAVRALTTINLLKT